MNDETPDIAPEELAERKAAVKDTGCCPYCDEKLHAVDLSTNPFNAWDTDEVWVCLNKQCRYRLKSEQVMIAQNIPGGIYRFLYVPARDWCGPVAENIANMLTVHPKG